MGIPEEVDISPNALGSWAAWDTQGKRFLFNFRGDPFEMHQILSSMTREQRWAYAKTVERLTK